MQGIEFSYSSIGAQGNIVLLRLKGFLDTTTAAEVASKLRELMNSNHYQYIVDMGDVNYVSSAGWGVFVGEIRSIRENGGDLKIIQMTPDVYDVFEMLEFDRILDYYETIEEAVTDFDLCQGLNITANAKLLTNEAVANVGFVMPKQIVRAAKTSNNGKNIHRDRFSFNKPHIDEAALPLVEKIKVIVIDNPADSLFKIRKKLNTPRFGNEKVGLLKVFEILNGCNLETKKKRYRFYRSR